MVYLLTGYKIEVIQNQWRLHPMYADNEKDVILFQRTQQGQLDLLETEFTLKLSKEVQILNKGNSIPAFLSHVIIDLFAKKQ